MVLFLLLFLFCGTAFAANVSTPTIGYDFTFGSDNYISHLLYGEVILHNAKKDAAFTGGLSFFHDVDYDIITSFTFKGRKAIKPDTGIGGLFILSRGNLADENSSSSSVSLGVSLDRDITQAANLKLEYRYTNGTIYTDIYRNINVTKRDTIKKKGQKQTTSTTTTTDSAVTPFSSNTIITELYTDLDGIIRNLTSTLNLSLSQNSNDVKVISFGLELFYPLNKKIYLSGGFTLTRDNLNQRNNYFSLGINHLF